MPSETDWQDHGPRHRVDDIAKSLPESVWKTITWREGGKGRLTKQFALVRLSIAAVRRDLLTELALAAAAWTLYNYELALYKAFRI